MLRSLLRLLCINLYLAFRANVTINKYDGLLVYKEDVYDGLAKGVQYTIHVTEVIWIVEYNMFLIPKLKRKQYRAELTYYKNGIVNRIFTDTYPKLDMGIGLMGPLYPLTLIAEQHITRFFNTELIT
jgi:hypothetical protein